MACEVFERTAVHAMLHSCPAARRVAAAAAIPVVMVCVGLVVVAAAFPLTCVPSLRKLVAISPPPCISGGSASHTPTLVRVSVWRSRSAHNHPPPVPKAAAAAARAVPPVAPNDSEHVPCGGGGGPLHRHHVEGRERRTEGELTGCYSFSPENPAVPEANMCRQHFSLEQSGQLSTGTW